MPEKNKMPEFYMISSQKNNFFSNWGEGASAPLPSVSYAYESRHRADFTRILQNYSVIQLVLKEKEMSRIIEKCSRQSNVINNSNSAWTFNNVMAQNGTFELTASEDY